MKKYVVSEVDSIAEREVRRFEIGGKAIALARLNGEFFALIDRCPHGGAPLSGGRFAHQVESDGPGDYRVCRADELLRCPWHGWEYDLRTGQSWSDPKSTRTRALKTEQVKGSDLVKGPYVAETVPVTVEGNYLIVELP